MKYVKSYEDFINEYGLGMANGYYGGYTWYTQADMARVSQVAMDNDLDDPLIKNFMDYIESRNTDEEKDKELHKKGIENQKTITEGDFGVAISASPSNTPGMGNATPPSANQQGSGDVFSGPADDNDEKGKIGIMSYEEYKKWVKKWQQKHQKE